MAKTTAAQRKSTTVDAAQTNGTKPEETKEVPAKKSQYPEGTKLFTYQPKVNGQPFGQPIEFPMEMAPATKEWLWELSELPFLNQTWAWMKHAKVPRAVQRQAVRVADASEDEYMELFTAWFKAMGGGVTPGE